MHQVMNGWSKKKKNFVIMSCVVDLMTSSVRRLDEISRERLVQTYGFRCCTETGYTIDKLPQFFEWVIIIISVNCATYTSTLIHSCIYIYTYICIFLSLSLSLIYSQCFCAHNVCVCVVLGNPMCIIIN